MSQDRNIPSIGDVPTFDGLVYRPMSIASGTALAGAASNTPTPLVTGSYVTAYQWSATQYGAPGGLLQLTKTDGSRLRRRIYITHNAVPSGADATGANIGAEGNGTHADFDMSTPDWLDADLSGAGATQVVRLRIKATANGPSWTATFYPDSLKAV